MANYTAADIKALRERTGAGMLDVKKALDEAAGDMEKATEILRVKGLKGVAKREGRATSEVWLPHTSPSPQPANAVCSLRSTAKRTSLQSLRSSLTSLTKFLQLLQRPVLTTLTQL